MAVRVFMLRHGESISNADRELAALPDGEGDRLTERGQAQVRAAADGLRGRGVTKLLSSPLRRAKETAVPIGERLGLEPAELEYVHELRESASYGHLDAEQQRLRRWSDRMYDHRDDPDHTEEGSESFNDVLGRVKRLKAELETQFAGETPLLVTHGIFLRFFLLDSLLGDAFHPGLAKRMWHLRSINCGLSIFESSEGGYPVDADASGWACLSWMERCGAL